MVRAVPRFRSPRGAFAYAVDRVRRSLLLSPQTQEDRNVRALYLNTAMVGVATGGIASFLPVYLARLGASPTLMGWFSSLPSLLLVFLLIPGGAVAERSTDQVAVRVRYAYILRSFYLLCALAPFVVPVEWLPLALVGIWSLTVFPEAVAQPAWTAVMSRAVSPRRRARVNSTRWALLAIVSALSSAFFGWLLDRVTYPLNYQLVFFISWALSGLDPKFFSYIRLAPQPEDSVSPLAATGPHRKAAWQRAADYVRPVFGHKPFVVYVVSTFWYRVALNMPAPLFSLYWVNVLHAPDTLIGLRGTVGNLALMIGYLMWGRLAGRLGHRPVLMLSAAGLALYPIATALAPASIWLLPAAAIWGMTASGVDVGLFDMALASYPAARQPLYGAVWSTSQRLAMFAGPLIGAALARQVGLGDALLIAGAAELLSVLPFFALPAKDSMLG